MTDQPLATIGVMGGMGPAATVEFFERLVTRAQRAQVHNGLRILVDSDPNVPDRTTAILGLGVSPGNALAAMAVNLIAAGADILAMPCNVAHAFESDIERAAPGRLVNIIDESTKAAIAIARKDSPVGVFGTVGTLHARLYQDRLADYGFETVVPDDRDQARLVSVIAAIKSGTWSDADVAALIELGEGLAKAGASCLIAGCTEVPMLLTQDALSIPMIDTLEVLANKVLERAMLGPTASASLEEPKGQMKSEC